MQFCRMQEEKKTKSDRQKEARRLRGGTTGEAGRSEKDQENSRGPWGQGHTWQDKIGRPLRDYYYTGQLQISTAPRIIRNPAIRTNT